MGAMTTLLGTQIAKSLFQTVIITKSITDIQSLTSNLHDQNCSGGTTGYRAVSNNIGFG
jgi:hypothetical protein